MNTATQTLLDKITTISTDLSKRIGDAVVAIQGNAVDAAAVTSALESMQSGIVAAIQAAVPAAQPAPPDSETVL